MYVNFASSLIKNWLLENGCKLKNEATSSESRYYAYGDITIRVSCHMPSCCSPNTVYVLIPINNQYCFGVFVNKRFCQINCLKELKSFFKSLFLILDINASSELAKVKLQSVTPDSIKDKKIKELGTKIGNLKIQLKDQKTKIDNQAEQLRIFQTKK